MCFLVFNVVNYLGSALAPVLKWPRGGSLRVQVGMCVVAFLRLGFVPLFMMCNLAPDNRSMDVGSIEILLLLPRLGSADRFF